MNLIISTAFIALLFVPWHTRAQSLTAQEHRSMLIASQRYPDLQKEGTPHYKAYQLMLTKSIQAKSVVFKDPNWPLLIAEKSRASLPTLQQGSRRVGRTDIEKYEDYLAKMLKSNNPKIQQYAQLAQAAHQAELSGDTAKAAEIRGQLAELTALGKIESLLQNISRDVSAIKQELQTF